jgi:hypothetical protein
VLAAESGVWPAHEILALDDIRDELRRAVGDVLLDGVQGDHQRPGDVLVGHPRREQFQNLPFPGGQRLDQPGDADRRRTGGR